MRTAFVALLLAPALALADPPANPASELDAQRLFNTTEVFKLAPGDMRAEVRVLAGVPNAQDTLQLRGEVGIFDHFQASVSEDGVDPQGQSPQIAATHLALRYSLGSQADGVMGNPAVEAEVTARNGAPPRAALRVLAAKELMPHLVVAANGYVEQNLDRLTPAGVDGTFGATAGVSYGLIPRFLHIGAEGQLGAAQYGGPRYTLAMAGGPNAVLSAGPVALTGTVLGNLVNRHVGLEPMVTLGCTF